MYLFPSSLLKVLAIIRQRNVYAADVLRHTITGAGRNASALDDAFPRNALHTTNSTTNPAHASASANTSEGALLTMLSATSGVDVSALADTENATCIKISTESYVNVSVTLLWSELRYQYTSHDMVEMSERKYQK